jgi:outer membrane protein assembly factor BamB
MQQLANRLIELLEAKELLPVEVVAELRRQVVNSKVRLQPELLARLLVDNGHLTKFQATKLITELNANPSSVQKRVAEEELGFAPSGSATEAILEEEVEPLLDGSPSRKGSGSLAQTNSSKGREESGSPQGAERTESSSKREPPKKNAGGDKKPAGGGFDKAASFHKESLPSLPLRATRSPTNKTNPWDSFRILGVGVILSLVLVAGFVLVRWMVRGNADDALQFADNAYQQRSYEDAANSYRNFAVTWPTHQMVSYSRIRAALASLRKELESSTNPSVALRTAEEVLPGVIGESGLADQQSDLAGALVSLAEKFIVRMDSVNSTEERKLLMDEMNRLLNFLGDPQLVGSTQRAQLAPSLQRIDESRFRIQREIQRDDELVIAMARIDKHLDARETFSAYDVRKDLINRYPLLESHPEIIQRVLAASEIQRELVKESPSPIEIPTEAATRYFRRTFNLSRSDGTSIPSLRGNLIFYQIRGSLYAIDAETGRILWSRVVGGAIQTQPVRVTDSPDSDVIVAAAETGLVMRLEGRTGNIQWSAQLGEIVFQPIVDSDELFLSTSSGYLVNMDIETGYAKWTRLLPQPIETGPAIRAGGKWIYQTASHSNIYVLDRRSGECNQVLYLGHRDGTIQVPPVFVMGHLILVENINLGSARIRILLSEDSRLQPSQTAIPMDGNVLSQPKVDGRQILVQSNLGNSMLLDVEPSAQGDKVTVLAKVPRNLQSPQTFWSAFANNQVWLAEKRLARFDLIVTQGALNRKWILHEGDEFVGPLNLLEEVLIHARRLNGNQGVRVSAANARDGSPIWTADLGVPVKLLHRDGLDRLDAVTSSGGVFGLIENEKSYVLDEPSSSMAVSLKRFTNPVWFSGNRAILLNSSNPREYALYSSDRPSRLKMMTLPLGSSQPSGTAIAVGQNIVLGLDNGQLLMFDPESGQLLGNPYQAVPMRPGQTIRWSQPAVIPNESALVVACDAGRIARLSAGDTLRPLVEAPLEDPLISPLVFFQDVVVAVESSSGRHQMASFNANNLQLVKRWPLKGRWISGPFALGEYLVVQTDQEVQAWDPNGNLQWVTSIVGSPLVAPPIAKADQTLLATIDGRIWLVNSKDGSIIGSTNVGHSISTSPLLEENGILLGSEEGVVSEVPIPTEDLLSGEKNW